MQLTERGEGAVEHLNDVGKKAIWWVLKTVAVPWLTSFCQGMMAAFQSFSFFSHLKRFFTNLPQFS